MIIGIVKKRAPRFLSDLSWRRRQITLHGDDKTTVGLTTNCRLAEWNRFLYK